ncbi:flagellin [Pseudodesulfovibrio sp.]|uniref:flagellin N-terminal helical domain-containing protein n=1 Tax=Pseudodesulfovibrio sp. TaxID=2035812 RepID=UPI002607BBBA|nr:flagellin [Pseudodesulfovibrio sp.]MDD3311190.1 flagellin [Pseudodesulfovibrio sp.]
MALTINHNLMAMNTARNLGTHYGALGVSTRRLSSGLRVGTAADDAAGLAISELGKAKASSLAQASRNIKDAVSLVQVADGGLLAVNAMIIRLKELAAQASTGTYNADQREIISNEMQQLTSEIERAQKDLEFNGIDLFKDDSVIEIQSGEENEENIFIDLPKTTATTLGTFTPTGQKSYQTGIVDGVELNLPQVGAALADTSTQSMADQTITISSAADVRTIEISAAKGNNNINGLLAEIENLEMDGIRETSAVSYADFIGFTKAELNGSYGDMVRFTFNSGGTGDPNYSHSFLIGRDEAETEANLFATLDRIVDEVNTANSDLDLSRTGTVLRSEVGKSLAIGDFELIDNPAVELGNFGDTPSAIPGGTNIPASEISFDIDGIPVTFEYSTSDATNMARAAAAATTALTNAGVFYNAPQYAADLTYASPHTREHYYTVDQNGTNNTVTITKINLTSTEASTPAGNLLNVTDLENNQTRVNVSNFTNYSGEEITLNIEGTDVSFTAAGSASQAANASRLVTAVNAAGIPGITADVNGTTAVIARTGSEDYIDIQYDDEDNNVQFSNYSLDEGATLQFELDGTAISYVVGATRAATAQNLETALGALGGGYTVARSGETVQVTKADNTSIAVTNFQDDGLNNATIGPFSNTLPGDTLSLTYTRSGTNYPVSFAVGASDAATALNLRNALNGAGIPNTSFGTAGNDVQVSATDNVSFEMSSLALSSVIEASIGTFANIVPGETVSFTYTRSGSNFPVSFLAGATDNDTATNMLNALTLAGVPNTTFGLSGNDVTITTTDQVQFRISNLSGTNAANIATFITPANNADAGAGAGTPAALNEGGGSITVSESTVISTITPDGGSTAGGGSGVAQSLSSAGGSITVNDISSSVLAGAGAGSTGGGTVNASTNRTITDQTTSLNAAAGAGSSNTGASVIFKNPGQDIGTSTTITNSRATATSYGVESGSYLDNAALGTHVTTSFNMREDDVGNVGEQDHITIDRINAGLRQVGLGPANSTLAGTIDSQHAGADPNAQWAMINGTGEFILDPNISFSISSNVDGTATSGEAGAFNAAANRGAELTWSSSDQISKGRIDNFSNTAGETISFDLNGVSLSYTAGATQTENSNLLLQELNDHTAALAAQDVIFERTSDETGIYLRSNGDQPLIISNYSGSGAGNSGFDVWLIDSPNTYQVDENNPTLSLEPWTSLSQMNYRTQEGASSSFQVINAALIDVTNVQGSLGADGNTLESHDAFIEIEKENTVAMVSRITDIDVANEMTEFVRNQILTQAAVAMLAQANSLPRMAMQLIGG